MTSSEKAHFKKTQSAYQKESGILSLFDYLNKMKIYNEDKILRFCGSKGKMKNQLTLLLNALMKSLQLYGVKNSVPLRLNKLLSEVEILFSKSAYSLGKNKIESGSSLAKKHELIQYELMFGLWEYIYMLKGVSAYDIDERKTLSKKLELNINEISKRTKLYHLASLCISFKQVYDIDEVRHLFETNRYYIEASKGNSIPKGNKGLFFHYNLLAGIKMELGEWENSMVLSKKALEVMLLEKN